MTAVAEIKNLKEAEKNIVIIYGKVTAVRKLKNKTTKENFFLTLLSLPNSSGDEFSHPQTVEVSSAEPVGNLNEVVTVKCTIGGYGRTFNQTDEDGVISKVRTADNVFRAL